MPSSCYSQTFKIDDKVKHFLQLTKATQKLFDTLFCLFVEYKKLLKLCEPEKAKQERIWKCMLDKAFTKFTVDSDCPIRAIMGQAGNAGVFQSTKNKIEAQIKTVAALKCDEPDNKTKCRAAGGKRVCIGTSVMCIPKEIADMKDLTKYLQTSDKQRLMIHEYQKVVIADLRRTLRA